MRQVQATHDLLVRGLVQTANPAQPVLCPPWQIGSQAARGRTL